MPHRSCRRNTNSLTTIPKFAQARRQSTSPLFPNFLVLPHKHHRHIIATIGTPQRMFLHQGTTSRMAITPRCERPRGRATGAPQIKWMHTRSTSCRSFTCEMALSAVRSPSVSSFTTHNWFELILPYKMNNKQRTRCVTSSM